MIILAISGDKREIVHQKMMRNPRFLNEICHTKVWINLNNTAKKLQQGARPN